MKVHTMNTQTGKLFNLLERIKYWVDERKSYYRNGPILKLWMILI